MSAGGHCGEGDIEQLHIRRCLAQVEQFATKFGNGFGVGHPKQHVQPFFDPAPSQIARPHGPAQHPPKPLAPLRLKLQECLA